MSARTRLDESGWAVKMLAARQELDEARKEEIEASNAYAGDDLTEDWHRGALYRVMRAEETLKNLLDSQEGR